MQSWLERDLVVIIDDQILEETVWRAIKQPFKATRVQVFKLLCIVVNASIFFSIDKKHIVANLVYLLDLFLGLLKFLLFCDKLTC